jgi:Domain of unknown function (DUF3127)
MAFELTGVIIDVFPAQTFNKGFRKREFAIETGDKYPQRIVFTLVQDKCDLLDSFRIGDPVSVGFDVKGRDWTDKTGQVKYFNTLEAWKLSSQGGSGSKSRLEEDETDEDIYASLGVDSSPKKSNAIFDDILNDDDLPFDL